MSMPTLAAPGATTDTPERFESRASSTTRIPFAFAPYFELTKPRLVVLVLLTTSVGFWLGSSTGFDVVAFVLTLVGTACVAGAACAWNQVLEHERDARMRRTARRPIPSGQAEVGPAALFSTGLFLLGAVLIALVSPLACAVAVATFLLYVCAYTPLKPVTTLNTAVGAVPGALPPLIGWAAASGNLGTAGWVLFLIVFLWQFPHFLAIAWIYREDYERAGMRMLPCVDPTGAMTSLQSCIYAALLLPAGLLPVAAGIAGPIYAVGALAAGLLYLRQALRFSSRVSDQAARKLLHASFLYLPVILFLLILNSTR